MTQQDFSAFEGTRPVADQQKFDIGALEAWMREHVTGFAGPLTVEQFKGGQSNPTFLLKVNGKPTYVLRRKPFGRLLPSAHAIEREYRVTEALAKAGYRAVAPYLRGCGPTRFLDPATPRSGQLVALGQDLVEFAAALGQGGVDNLVKHMKDLTAQALKGV